MKEFKGKVAVITGAASGIGLAIAKRCGQEGMKVVLADIEEKALGRTEAEMKAAGATALAVLTDVSKPDGVEAMAQKTLDAFGVVHLLCNNAGIVVASDSIWESSLNDWKWIIGVNLWGIIHGIRVFVPIMLEQDTECNIVNTASIAGLTSSSIIGPYGVTKHGVVSLSETLYLQLAERGAKVKVSVLCPGYVNTRLWASERNRPDELQNVPSTSDLTAEDEAVEKGSPQPFETGISPDRVADDVFNAISDDKFYILTHPETKHLVQLRMEKILQERNPESATYGS